LLQAVAPALRHHRTSLHTPPAALLTSEQQALYAVLRAKAQNPATVHDPAAFSLYVGWRESLEVVDDVTAATRHTTDRRTSSKPALPA
jgi:hypothetical protein